MNDEKKKMDDLIFNLRMSEGEWDIRIPLPKVPKHVSMIRICPKERKRGNYVIFHALLKKLNVPFESDKQLKIDSELMFKNILALEVESLLEQVLNQIKKKKFHIEVKN